MYVEILMARLKKSWKQQNKKLKTPMSMLCHIPIPHSDHVQNPYRDTGIYRRSRGRSRSSESRWKKFTRHTGVLCATVDLKIKVV